MFSSKFEDFVPLVSEFDCQCSEVTSQPSFHPFEVIRLLLLAAFKFNFSGAPWLHYSVTGVDLIHLSFSIFCQICKILGHYTAQCVLSALSWFVSFLIPITEMLDLLTLPSMTLELSSRSKHLLIFSLTVH